MAIYHKLQLKKHPKSTVQLMVKFTITLVFLHRTQKFSKKFAIFCQVHEKCTISKMHVKMFSARE